MSEARREWITSNTWDFGEPERQRLDAIADCIVGDSLLDIGCRDATLSLTMAKEHPKMRVVGVDISEVDTAWANEQAVKLELENFVAHTMDLFDAKSLGSFSTVVCSEVLEHLPPARVDEAFNLGMGMATKRLIVTTPANSHVSDPDHRSVFYREMFHGRPNLHWIPRCPFLWLAFYLEKGETK